MLFARFDFHVLVLKEKCPPAWLHRQKLIQNHGRGLIQHKQSNACASDGNALAVLASKHSDAMKQVQIGTFGTQGQ
jgi:hypothetical protein